ncbi:putative lipase atg15 [Mortierella sp. GBA30]|nr:putative lipase atg15 [Mortierella sp. GBA30]
MAQVNRLLGNHDTGYAGTMFEHTLSDTAFTVEDSEEGDDNDDDNDGDDDEAAQNLIPLPWKRVPNAKDHGTVVSMIRMSLDCYVDPKRQGWVDIGDKWEVETEIGWLEAGLRGYIFVSEDKKTVVLGIKGTSLKLFGTGGGPTANKDKKNDNKMFSCCCGKVDRTWWAVCGCYMGGSQCSQQCLVDDLVKDRDEEESYHGIGLKVIEVVRDLYPNADIWLTGHSLGGGVASMLGVTKGYPVFTFQTPGDVRYAQRIGLVKQQLKSRDLKKMPVWHFGHTADPVFMGTCNGPMSTCYSAGYALETKCHLGRTCIYDTMTELGWRQSIQSHTIFTFINVVENWPNMTQGREIVGPCLPQTECQDCAQWEYV